MVIEYIRYRIPAALQADFIADYRTASAALDRSPECLAYEMSHCEEEPDRFILRVEWPSAAAHLEGFRQSEQFRDFLPLVRPYIEYMEEMQHYDPTGISNRK
ncbi:MAG: putative quinol monooxygenase [Betaproteobacteria bacterium]